MLLYNITLKTPLYCYDLTTCCWGVLDVLVSTSRVEFRLISITILTLTTRVIGFTFIRSQVRVLTILICNVNVIISYN